MKSLFILAPLVLVACGTTMPVKATVVDCSTKQPLEGVQFDRMGTITRSSADGTWESTTIGEGDYPVDALKQGYKKEKFSLKPGAEGQTVCMTPEG